MYTLDDVKLLSAAICALSNDSDLTPEQEAIISKSYDEYFIQYAKKTTGVDISRFPVELGLIRCGLSREAKWYNRRDDRTSGEVLGHFIGDIIKDSSVPLEEKEKLLLTKVLLENRNKAVSLRTLFFKAHEGLYNKRTIESMYNDLAQRDKFFERLNGCIVEETVSEIDMSSFNPNDFSSIRIRSGSAENPLLFVSGVNLTEMSKLGTNGEDEVCFITISDLHLDKGCIRSDGRFDDKRFEENLMAFGAFKDRLLSDFAKRGQKIGGIVFTGDIIDGLTKGNNRPVFIRSNREDLASKYVAFCSKHPKVTNITDKKDGPGFVAYIAGNHDMTVGKDTFDAIMHSLVGEDAQFIGAGQARIKVGEEFMSVLHHDSLDWGLPTETGFVYKTRDAKNNAVFQFDSFFAICESYLDRVADKSSYTLDQLFADVGQKMQVENPALYKFYAPYITSTDMAPAFFVRNMYIDANSGKLCRQLYDDRYPKTMKFHDYMKDNPDLVQAILANGGVIPEFARNDRYRPIVTSLSHFHESIGTRDERVSFAPVVDEGKKVTPIAVSEDSRSFEAGAHQFSVTLYEAAMDKNHVTQIGVIPIVASVKKVYVKGQAKFSATLDYLPGEEIENPGKTR